MKQWFDQYITITIADLIAIAISYAIKMVIASILLHIGFWLINKLLRVAERALHFKNFDVTFKKFTRNLLNFGLKTI